MKFVVAQGDRVGLWMWPQEEPGTGSTHRLGDSIRLPSVLTALTLDMC